MFKIKSYHYRNETWNQPNIWFLLWVNQDKFTNVHSRCRTDCTDYKTYTERTTPWSPQYSPHGAKRWYLSLPWDAKFRHIRIITEVRKCYHGVILSTSQPLQWHRLTQERGFLTKSEPCGQTRPDTTPWRLKDPTPWKHQWLTWTWQIWTRQGCHFQLKCVKGFDHLVNFASSPFCIPN